MRQASCIGGGTVEMARNAITERMLGMPRELATDRGVPSATSCRAPAAELAMLASHQGPTGRRYSLSA